MKPVVRIGVIGGGLMGREVANALARWFVLENFPVRAELVAVCDVQPKLLDWFRQVPTVRQFTTDHHELLRNPDVDVVYVAVPHQLHEAVYLDVLNAGKDLFAEKPFGIDLGAAERIAAAVKASGRFVRVSSEFPFLPGAQRALAIAGSGKLGRLIEVRVGYLHSSDLDPLKPANWKRQTAFCGEVGVLGDLGLHAVHVPLRLGWKPQRVYAQLQRIYTERPDGKGGVAPIDTWDNATLATYFDYQGTRTPLRVELKRFAPGETNTWYIEVLGTEGGVRYSTKTPKTLWTFRREKEQIWDSTDLGFQMVFPAITGAIFEPGFPDILLQMWAAFLAERAGALGGRFGCATVDEAVDSHRIWAAALASQRADAAVNLPG
ncbi:Gfo/Idh/MocA family protein [Horticoccus sp. 23ND18S-11]|uniref:Gfo/Idh/MocA family protein n=1 Tax=Horticoccus sp. 23ND18S-11 TaxID=3391832 RepID=UPI0039C91DE5